MVPATPQNPHPGIPFTPGAIARPRILSGMRAALLRRLTVVTAPPGYGKSTLVAQFVHTILSEPDTQHIAAWHTIIERDRDIGNLHRAVLAALEHICPDITHDLPDPRNLSPVELAVALTDYITQNIPDNLILVLDDAHLLARSPDTEAWLNAFVQRIPQNCNLILATRMMPSLPLTDMIARREVLALGQKDLRLTKEETASLAESMTGQNRMGAETLRLVERLEGWPAGVVLALQPLPPEIEHTILSGRGPEALFDTMAEAMLNTQPPGLRNFLLHSSTLRRMTPDLCAATLELNDSARWLREASNRNLFVLETNNGYTYHALFRALLQRTLQHRDPERFLSLHRKAGEWFESQDDLEEAVDHYLEAGDVMQAGEIVERVAAAFVTLGNVQTLLDWQKRFSNSNLATPNLAYNCARILIDQYQYDAAEAALNEAESEFITADNQQGLLEIQVRRLMITWLRGDYENAANKAISLLEEIPTNSPARAETLRALGTSMLHLGRVEESIDNFLSALELCRATGDDYMLSQILQDLDFAYTRMGDLTEASKYLQELVALSRSMGSLLRLASAYNNLGCHYHARGNYQRARECFDEGLAAMANLGGGRIELYISWSYGDLERDLGRFEKAEKLFNRAFELRLTNDNELESGILTSLSTLRRWQGNLNEADELANEAWALASKHHNTLRVAAAQIALQAARLPEDNSTATMEQLSDIIDNLEQQNARIQSIHALGLRAYAALFNDQSQMGLQDLDKAQEIAQSIGSAQLLAAEIAHTPKLEKFVNEHAERYPFLVDNLTNLRNAKGEPAGSNVIVRDIPLGLRIYTLGRELVEVDGTLAEWRSQAARELFFYLLFKGELARDEIALVFWPESAFDEVRSNFHTTLNRTRKALGGTPSILFDSARKLYRINPAIKIWCDAFEMESMAEQARHLSSHSARAEDLWTKAASLYRGDFLPKLDAAWITTQRMALQEIYIECLYGAGSAAIARNDFKAALEIFKRAEAEDPYREDTHRAILSCYSELDLIQQMRSHYEKFQNLLRTDLRIQPSPETQAHFHNLVNH